MRISKRVKRLFVVCCMLVCAIITAIANNVVDKASAATKGYFNDYTKLTTIEHGDGYDGIQGMSVYGEWAYYAKLQIKNKRETGKCGIWAYNLRTGNKIKVYNGTGNNAVFKVGHANCLFVNSKYMYIAAGEANKGVIRYDLDFRGDRVNLTNKKIFKLYSEKNKQGDLLPVSGIEYAGSLGDFLVKCGDGIYRGQFVDGYFDYQYRYRLDTHVKCRDEVLNIQMEQDFTRQSMYFEDGIIYLPMSSKIHPQQSIVVGFKLDVTIPDGYLLNSVDDSIVRITSNNAYPHLYEAEAVDNYQGKMIMAVNGRKDVNGKAVGEDIIVEVKDFSFEPQVIRRESFN